MSHTNFLKCLVGHRERLGLTQRQAARLSGISQNRLAALEQGRFDFVSPGEILRLSEAYNDAALPLLFCAACSALLRGAAPEAERIAEQMQTEIDRHLLRMRWLAEHRDGLGETSYSHQVRETAAAITYATAAYSILLIQISPPDSPPSVKK